MDISESMRQLELTPHDNKRLAKLCGQFDENLHPIEPHLGVEINNWGSDFEVIGIPKSIDKAAEVLKASYKEAAYRRSITPNEVFLRIREMDYPESETKHKEKVGNYELKAHQLHVKARTPNQQHYLNAIQKYDINFGIGPSGTGKTFLAVACGVWGACFRKRRSLAYCFPTRPAVGTDEKLAYLPGDLMQKK